MLCDYCQKNEATNVLKQTINGKTKMLHICDSCANSMLFSNLFSDFSINHIFTHGLQPMHAKKVCEKCGMTLDDIMSSGKVGCDRCYDTFAAELSRSIEQIHGKSSHTGKAPKSASGKLQQKNKLEELKTQLSRLIEAQDFEQAAVIRDQIKALEQEINHTAGKEEADHE
ncbi:UvrB/UvrC motif-containing protein [Massiliimalia timonensis]|uniref:UvrB/UvrC motif-containing protein n=1 Tax=Massiliimalia timonensis TaxID=1987501 RepID=UPI0018A0DE49|nr:UvrB/UvrC motif-containing protein [Massiliimalia timonensis]